MALFGEYGKYDQIKVLSFTRDSALASGAQAVTGIGFKPTDIVVMGVEHGAVGEFALGMGDGTFDANVRDQHNGAPNTYGYDPNYILYLKHPGPANFYTAVINSFDADGFTFGWVKTGAPTGTITVLVMAFR